MGKLLGNDYRLWIESATAGTFNEIKGQQSMSLTRAAATFDTSTKDDFPYGTQGQGLRSLSIDCNLIPNLPDANGYTRLETRSKVAGATRFQIRKGGSAGNSSTDVVFDALMLITNFDADFGQNDAVKSKFQLILDTAPTVDALA
jgi:hypothetical protein